MKRFVILAAAAAIGAAASADVRAEFTLGDVYATYSTLGDKNAVAHYDSSGTYIDSKAIPSSSEYWSTRGLAFGPDGLMYVVQDRFLDGLAVLAYDSSGALQQTYAYSGPGDYVGGNTSYGKIAFDGAGHFYVGAGALISFDLGVPGSGNSAFFAQGSGIFDVKALSNGHLLVASSYAVFEVDAAWNVLRELGRAETGGAPVRFTNLQGIEYDESTGVLYASMLGYTGFEDQVMKIDYATGALLGSTTIKYANDLFLGPDDRLLVGASSLAGLPQFLDLDLNPLGALSGDSGTRSFVTRVVPTAVAAVPEPASLAMLGVGLATALAVAQRRRAG